VSESKIKSCPFCGNKNVEVIQLPSLKIGVRCTPTQAHINELKWDYWDENPTEAPFCLAEMSVSKLSFTTDEDCKEYLISKWNRRDG
jgi:hypothetical protein